MIKNTVLLCCWLCQLSLYARAADIEIKSPDGRISFQLSANERQLMYSISFNGVPVILHSPLVLSLDGKPVTTGAQITGSEKYSINESFPWRGAHARAVNHCNGSRIKISSGTVNYTIDVRVFDGGAAFQTIIPGGKTAARIPDESTVFTLPAGADIWYHDLNMHYEGVHVKKEIGSVQAGEWVAPPATVRLSNNTYASITEADLQNYSGF